MGKGILHMIASQLYISVVHLRHMLFDMGILRSYKFQTPVICVGNITVGGTGKTPVVELLLEQLRSKYQVAVLSRGYGRKSRGYRQVEVSDNPLMVGDEPLQIKQKFRDTLVVVCESRVKGVERIERDHPHINMIVMDDGFQHRQIIPAINIVTLDATRPFFEDHPLPLGELRDTPRSLERATIFIVTKCPERMTPLEMSYFRREIEPLPYQSLFYSRIENSAIEPIWPIKQAQFSSISEPKDVIAMCGLGNPRPFVETLKSRYNVVEELIYVDHHKYTSRDYKRILDSLERNANAVVVTTDKDRVKLLYDREFPQEAKARLYFLPMTMSFVVGSNEQLLSAISNTLYQDRLLSQSF